MGVGKSHVGRRLNLRLPDSVFLDGDWCWAASPFKVTEETKAMVLDNVCHTLNNFLRCSEYENIVFCWVMHLQSTIDDILSEIDASQCNIVKVSLICSPQTLIRRLKNDETRDLSDGVIERSLERLSFYSQVNTVKINTDGKSIDEVVAEICDLAQNND